MEDKVAPWEDVNFCILFCVTDHDFIFFKIISIIMTFFIKIYQNLEKT